MEDYLSEKRSLNWIELETGQILNPTKIVKQAKISWFELVQIQIQTTLVPSYAGSIFLSTFLMEISNFLKILYFDSKIVSRDLIKQIF